MAQTELNVSVSRVLYPPAMNPGDWYVLLTDAGKCSGPMKWRPEQGERLTLSGEWGAYRGERNFRFAAAMPNVPCDPRDMLRYVCERTSGIGPALEDAIWAAAGVEWQDIRAGDVPRLTGSKYAAFQESISLLRIEKEKSQAIGWLMGKGASVGMAMAAWERWGKETIGVVQGNCYRLTELPHFGFVHVDGTIRAEFGITDDDKRRIEAGIIYAMHDLTASGSTVVEYSELRDRACILLGSRYATMICEATRGMFQDGSLTGFPDSKSLALRVDYQNESLIWEWIGQTGKDER